MGIENQVSLPTGPVSGAASISQVKRHLQGRVTCVVGDIATVDTQCKRAISGNRVMCSVCRDRLLAADVNVLTFDKRTVDVTLNEATLIDVLSRIKS